MFLFRNTANDVLRIFVNHLEHGARPFGKTQS